MKSWRSDCGLGPFHGSQRNARAESSNYTFVNNGGAVGLIDLDLHSRIFIAVKIEPILPQSRAVLSHPKCSVSQGPNQDMFSSASLYRTNLKDQSRSIRNLPLTLTPDDDALNFHPAQLLPVI